MGIINSKDVIDVLNSLEVVEFQSGEDPYISVADSKENRGKLTGIGVSNEVIDKYSDKEHICILSLATTEDYSDLVTSDMEFIKFEDSASLQSGESQILLARHSEGLHVIHSSLGSFRTEELTSKQLKDIYRVLYEGRIDNE